MIAPVTPVPVELALISAGAGIVAAALGVLNSYYLSKAHSKIVLLEHNTNALTEALIKATGDSEFARGLKEGKESKGKKGASSRSATDNPSRKVASADAAGPAPCSPYARAFTSSR